MKQDPKSLMCGIVGYIGKRDAATVLLNGLKRLEYRGYDSAGIAVLNGALSVIKQKGSVGALERAVADSSGLLKGGTIGIGHTRWATHGDPSDRNAHPHLNAAGDIALIHNGIIENHTALRQELSSQGYTFLSDTDTEVLVHLIDRIWNEERHLTLEGVVRRALHYIEGAYGICVISSREPETLIVARMGSPLVLGIGEQEYFIASDAAPIIEYTKKVIYLADGEMAVMNREGFAVKTDKNEEAEKNVTELDFKLEEIEKGGFEHFMLKEIFEQPSVMQDVMRGRIHLEDNTLHLGGVKDHLEKLRKAKRIIICACGTSWHAGLIGEYLIEEFARIPVEVDYASEFRYRTPIISPDDVVMVISQSGETADTLAALRMAKEKGALVMGICNVVGSTIARETTCGMYTHAGPEIGVASTKAFTAQVIVLYMLALALSIGRTIKDEEIALYLKELSEAPQKAASIIAQHADIRAIAKVYKDARNFLYLGRGFNFPVALEGALKLKEISYIHAEGYPAAEMKHGPIALIDKDMPVIFIATRDSTYTKILSNIEEVRTRKGKIIAIATEGDQEISNLADHVIYIPYAAAPVTPLLTVIPLQLLSYYIATERGCNVDRPRNLAKSVTVE
ncbi:glutamine--fructose-6-phosphate transaminase [Chlorobium phaeobacteroides DSM 266]|uniref:Glutamine--fructose-6-phosphate aminotransferase [isomerizing] n=2 Tax=Chlorobium phaeobacteroides TaxID=1096 RepID=A1BJT3_CHLPD|nr:glutamine--fructose-6-phosphate transaminase [Chlorobium phaeobacteroides DSM 266]